MRTRAFWSQRKVHPPAHPVQRDVLGEHLNFLPVRTDDTDGEDEMNAVVVAAFEVDGGGLIGANELANGRSSLP